MKVNIYVATQIIQLVGSKNKGLNISVAKWKVLHL